MHPIIQEFETTSLFATLVAAVIVLVCIYQFLSIEWISAEKKLTRDLQKCVKDLEDLIETTNCNPLLLRLAWSDAVTFDSNAVVKEWPFWGGVNGSIRFDSELDLAANAGLRKAIDLLTPIKKKYRVISWADLIQLAGVVAIRKAGGPIIDLFYGRIDMPIEMNKTIQSKTVIETSHTNLQATDPSKISPAKKVIARRFSPRDYILPVALPCPCAPYSDGSPSADAHIRNIFYRLGFNNKEIVALCGAHTLGRAFKERSGICANSSGEQGATVYTGSNAKARADGAPGVGMPGGRSWTKNWLQFDNSYFKNVLHFSRGNGDKDLLVMPTDAALYECPEFRPYLLKFAENQEEFFHVYSSAHKKMSELGSKFKFIVNIKLV